MKLGIIGYGARIRDVMSVLEKVEPECRITGIVDIRKDKQWKNRDGNAIPFYNTPEEMIDSCSLDGIMIGTRCSSHASLAAKVLPGRIPLFLEKPVATAMDDLLRLKQVYEANPTPVVVSFPLRVTTIVQLVKEIIDSGKIGTVEHIQAINNVPYGAVYFQGWFRDEKETGGLFLQKATHDFDYLNYVTGLRPVSVCAMTSKQIFKGNKPAGLKCEDCDERFTCPDSTVNTNMAEKWPYCPYAEDTGNEDSGSALVRYESGMHASYSQNFFVRRKAGARGARFMGYKGTVEFDFYTKKVLVFMHHTPRVETYELEPGEGHFGGDEALVKSFVELMRGGSVSAAPLEDGLLSALLCLKARESAQTGTFQAVDWS